MSQDQEWIPDSDAASEDAAFSGPGPAMSVVIVIGLILLAAVLRIIGIGQFSFWIDEIRTVALAGVPCPPFMTSLYIHPDAIPWSPANLLGITQGPLFAGLVHLWNGWFGAGEAISPDSSSISSSLLPP